MTCKTHPSDISSSVGACASCLRERLLVLIAAQAEEGRRKLDRHNPPLIIQRSVSPYICRISDDSSWKNHHNHHIHNDLQVNSTPQVDPTTTTTTTNTTITARKQQQQRKFSLLSHLFRSSGSEESKPDHRISRENSTPSPISSSWFFSLLSGHRKKQSQLYCIDEAAVPHPTHRRSRRRRDRGMSPSTEDKDENKSPSDNGYLSESSPAWRRFATTPPRRRGPPHHGRNVSGLTFCLSPLVWASPNRQWHQKDAPPPSMAFPGEIGRGLKKPHLSTAASFCANRSRKLADFGRYNSFNS